MSATDGEAHGLQQMRHLLRHWKPVGMARTLSFTLVEVEDGRAVFEANAGSHVYNPYQTAHGGFAATLLDSACGIAVHTKLGVGEVLGTLEMKVSYFRPITAATGRLRATGTVLSMGRKAAFAEAKLVDCVGLVLASATATLMRSVVSR